MAVKTYPGYLRVRVINRSPAFWYRDSLDVLYLGPTPTGTVNTWNSIGTDCTGTLNYWTTDAGSPSIASNVVTCASGAWLHGGHPLTTDGVFTVRLQWNTGAVPHIFIHGSSGSTNAIYASLGSSLNTLAIGKTVASVNTNQATAGVTLVNGTKYWLRIIAKGTSYTAQILQDSAGSIGASLTSCTAVISDSALQVGYVGLKSFTATTQFGGAFATVCTLKGKMPVAPGGFYTWNTVVNAGEPAFSYIQPPTGGFGDFLLSIYNANSGGNGSWKCSTALAANNNTLLAIAQADAGTANVSVDGLTTNNVTTDNNQHVLRASGAMTANSDILLNFSGAVGTAYFGQILIRFPGAIITEELPHPHLIEFEKVAMQPHNPGSSTVGSFKIPLFPPGTKQFRDSKKIYDQLDRYLRVEFYLGYSPNDIGQGKLVFAGFITEIAKKKTRSGASYELKGCSDLVIANLSRPFPGDVLLSSYGGVLTALSLIQANTYLGNNEVGFSDDFNPYTSGNYVSGNVSGKTAGAWTSDSDDGLPVLKCSTGSGAALISKYGAGATDGEHNQYVEVSVRLKTTSTSTSNAGKFGIGLSTDSGAVSADALWITVVAKYNGGQYDVDVSLSTTGSDPFFTLSNFLTSVVDQDGYITVSIAFLTNDLITQVTLNGKTGTLTGGTGPLNINCYPFLFFGTPATGTATGYFANLIQLVRYAADAHDDATFVAGDHDTAIHSLKGGTSPGPTFLEIWTRAAIREGWYWKYTEQAFVEGIRTLGSVSFLTEPGNDLSNTCVFSFEKGNLSELSLVANDDTFATGSAISASSGTDGGGIAYWKDIVALRKYGVLDDQTLFLTSPNFAEQRKAANQVVSNKVRVGAEGSKIARVLRDAETVDKWRELDIIQIDDDDMGMTQQNVRIIAFKFKEGEPDQEITLDQFPISNLTVPQKRAQQGLFQISAEFGNR